MESRCNILYHIRSHGFFEFQYVYHMIYYFWVEFNKGYDKLGRHVRQRQWLLFRFVVFFVPYESQVLRRGCRLDVMHESVSRECVFFLEKRRTWGLVPRKTRSQERVQRMGKAIAQAEILDEEMERKHQRKPWRMQFSFPNMFRWWKPCHPTSLVTSSPTWAGPSHP